MNDIPDLPRVRVKPKFELRAIRHGAPWVYDNDLVLDRRTRKIEPGTLALLESNEREPIALIAFNAESKLAARVLDLDLSAEIDLPWLTRKIEAAFALRARMFDAPYYRLVHAEADGLPGVIIDLFGQIAVMQPNTAWAESNAPMIAEAVAQVTGATCVLKNAASRARLREGLDDASNVLLGSAPEAPVPVPMNGATYMADLIGGQKTGLFFDQRFNHAFAASLVRPGDQVLDVFCHVGGFGLAMLKAGAGAALAVDGSAAALALAEAGAKASDVAEQFETRQGDAFDTLSDLQNEGAQFDIVICDPPAFAPSKQALGQGLRAYERVARLAAPLVKPGGILGLCSCSNAAELSKFRASCERGIGRAGHRAKLIHTGFAGPDHPSLPGEMSSAYLKALFYAL